MSKFYIGNKLALDPDVKLEKVELTQTEYDALTTKKSNVLYLITDAVNPLEELTDKVDTHLENGDLKHIPTGGKSGLILGWKANGEAEWQDFSVLNQVTYGVEWDTTSADPHLTRIGNLSLHKTLPIQSGMKGCIYNSKEQRVVYWLDSDNWKYKEGGNPSKGETETLARLDGYDGEVMVYIPEFWIRSFSEGTKRRVLISITPLSGYTHQPAVFLSAYKLTVLNTVPEDMGYLSTLPVNSAISVVNTNTYCRGYDNSTTYDEYLSTEPARSCLGKPRTGITRATMRTYARNTGNYLMSYELYKNIFYWLYVIEYANFNCLEAFNEELTAEGYKQGGLGAGVTTISSNLWSTFNNYNPITPCGYTNDLGNRTGTKALTISISDTSVTFNVPRWHGIENSFADHWLNLDGIIVDANTHTENVDYVYTCQDPDKYADTITADYLRIGDSVHSEGYAKFFNLGDAAHILANSVGADGTTYKCDYHYVGEKNSTLRTVIVGGPADNGALAGLGYLYSYASVACSWAYTGFRTAAGFSRPGLN